MKVKRLAALVLCLTILLALIPNLQLTAFADNFYPSTDVYYYTDTLSVGDYFSLSWDIHGGVDVRVTGIDWEYLNEKNEVYSTYHVNTNLKSGTITHKTQEGGKLLFNLNFTCKNKYGEIEEWSWWNTDTVYVNGWTADGWAYYENGYRLRGWFETQDGNWYFPDTQGFLQTGWVKNGGSWYCFDSEGAMQTGWVKDGSSWYYIDYDGTMQTGWVKDGSWYYFTSSGAMKTGWVSDGGSWYYFNSSGAMKTGWVNDGGSWYYFNSSGAMKTGWLQQGSTWYYLWGSGTMATGTHYIDGLYNNFDSSGVWLGYK